MSRALSSMALSGVRVIEFAGLAPAPLCGMILADFGADVIRVDRTIPDESIPDGGLMARGKRSISINVKHPEGKNVVKDLCASADVLLEPYRRGVMERLDLGPDILCKLNPRLVYTRLTGYGQTGVMADKAGHDINYISLSGVLSHLGRATDTPHPPINLLADFAGGSIVCALGIMMALYERSKSGKGQVIDSNMVEGSAYISSFLWSTAHINFMWPGGRGQNLLDGGQPYYDTYKTKDGKYMAVGALEPQFYAQFIQGLDLTDEQAPQFGMDKAAMKKVFTEKFASKTQEEWVKIFEPLDACVTPILSRPEAASHPHNTNSFMTNQHGLPEPMPAPRLSRTPGIDRCRPSPVAIGQHTVDIMRQIGYTSEAIDKLRKDNVLLQAKNAATPKL